MATTTPHYVHSPGSSKRRRLSIEGDHGAERMRQAPRLIHSPGQGSTRQVSPTTGLQPGAPESWSNPPRTTPYLSNGGVSSPAPCETNERPEPRSALHSLPPPRTLEREPPPPPPRTATTEAHIYRWPLTQGRQLLSLHLLHIATQTMVTLTITQLDTSHSRRDRFIHLIERPSRHRATTLRTRISLDSGT